MVGWGAMGWGCQFCLLGGEVVVVVFKTVLWSALYLVALFGGGCLRRDSRGAFLGWQHGGVAFW